MATPIKPGTKLRRQTAVTQHGRPLIIELHPAYMVLREKGRRESVSLEYKTAMDLAYKLLWRQQQRQKQR